MEVIPPPFPAAVPDMAGVSIPLTITGAQDCSASLTSLAALLPLAPAALARAHAERPSIFADIPGDERKVIADGPDGGSIFADEAPALIAGEAVFQLKPNEWYLGFCAALAAQLDGNISFRHGWPILSLAAVAPSVTDGPGAGEAADQAGRA